MRLTLDALAVLDAIDRKGSFAAAAKELYRVPSAITYAVQKLEQDLGVTVFERSGHRAVLTPAGAALLEEGRHLLRASAELECRVKRIATGWESELRVAVNDFLPLENLFPLLERFYALGSGTRLRLSTEVLGGCWDALYSGRADLAVGVPGDGPPGGGFVTRPLGSVPFVYAVAPRHPLADAPEPLTRETLLAHRAVAAADSSRVLPPRTVGLYSGQDVLTVPTMADKLAAQLAGLGGGHLPAFLVAPLAAEGRLVVKATEEGEQEALLWLAWPSGAKGRALEWFVDAFLALPPGALWSVPA